MAIIKESDHLIIPFQDIKKATENFSTLIGRGGFGSVYRGQVSLSGELTTVAVKKLDILSRQGRKEFLTEIRLLSRYKHQNLVSLVGFSEEENEKFLIYEYAERGSLDSYLKPTKPWCPLTWKQRINICLDAARGLDHLHNHVAEHERVIHRDIKSANILIDHNWKAMIADFGLSKIGRTNEDDTYLITNVCGTPGYLDPAYFNTGILTKESDVYSFGVVLIEVLCGRLCIINANNVNKEERVLTPLAQRYYKEEKLDLIMDHYLKYYMKSDSMKVFLEIAFQCLQGEREQRPSMDLVLQELEKALKLRETEELAEMQAFANTVENKKWKKKAWSPQDATMLIQIKFRAYLIRKSRILYALRELGIVKGKLTELMALLNNSSYRCRVARDADERHKFSEKIIVLFLNLDAIEGANIMTRAVKRSIVDDLDAMLDIVDPQPRGGNSLSLNMRIIDMQAGVIQKEVVVGVAQAFAKRAEKKKGNKELSLEDAAMMIQISFRVYLIRRSLALRALRELSIAKGKLKELKALFKNPTYHGGLAHDEEARQKFSERIIVLVLTVDAIEGANILVRNAKRSMLNELDAMLEIVGTQSRCVKSQTLKRRTSNKPDGGVIQKEVAEGVTQAFAKTLEKNKVKKKELSPHDAAMMIQIMFRAYLIRKSIALHALRELAIAKGMLKEVKALFNNYSYRRRLTRDKEERQKFSDRIIVLLLTVDAIEGANIMARAVKSSMLDDLEAMLDTVDPQPRGGNSLSLNRRIIDMLTGVIQKEVVEGVAQAFAKRVEKNKGKNKELSIKDAAMMIQISFRVYLIRRSQALRALRELAIAKGKLKELKALFNNPAYHGGLAHDEDARQKFSERIIVLLLTVDAIEGANIPVRHAKRSMLDELKAMLDIVDPQSRCVKPLTLKRRTSNMPDGGVIQKQVAEGVTQAFAKTLEKNKVKKRKELSPQDAALMIQIMFRAYLLRKSMALRALRELAIAKGKLKEVKAFSNNYSYGRVLNRDEEARERFSERIIVLLLTVDTIEGANILVRYTKRSMLDELEAMLDIVDPQSRCVKPLTLKRRTSNMPDGGVIQKEVAEAVTQAFAKMLEKNKVKKKKKELSPQDAAMMIQIMFRAHLMRTSRALHAFRELAIAKGKLKELTALFNNYSYRLRLTHDKEERQKFSERIIVLLLTVDAIEGANILVRGVKRSMVDELDALLEVVDPQPVSGKSLSLKRRAFDMRDGVTQ